MKSHLRIASSKKDKIEFKQIINTINIYFFQNNEHSASLYLFYGILFSKVTFYFNKLLECIEIKKTEITQKLYSAISHYSKYVTIYLFVTFIKITNKQI